MPKKIKKYKDGGLRHNPHTDSGFSKAVQPKSVIAGGNDPKTVTGGKTQISQNTNNVNTGNQSGNKMIMPVAATLAKAFVIDPIINGVRQQKVKGENIFGKTVGLPASRDYYRAFKKPIDVMSPEGTAYMKEAGLIKPTPPGGTPDDDPKQLCPDGTFPPCKTPLTQIKNPVTTQNKFLSGFQSYDDGGEVVISSNVDKDLL